MTERDRLIAAGLIIPSDKRVFDLPTLWLRPGERERFERQARERLDN